MTVIAAMVHQGVAWMAADTMASNGSTRFHGVQKIHRLTFKGGYALASSAGDVGIMQLFANGLIDVTRGPTPAREDKWANAIADAITEACAQSKPPMVTGDQLSGDVLLAHKGRLWAIDAHSALPVADYVAIGSGGEYALGAMTILAPLVRRGVITAQEAVRRAAGAGVEWSLGCGGVITTDQA